MNEREQIELNEQLINAAQEGKVGQTMELIEAGADVNAVNKEGKTPLCIAAMKGYRGVVELLLSEGANVNEADVLAESFFSFAFKIGSSARVFNKRNISLAEMQKQILLHIAVAENHKKGVELLLDRGANVNAVDNLGMTPLHFALQYDRKELVRLLLDRGANVNAVDKKGRTPLSIIASDYQIRYCNKPMPVKTIIAYALLHSDTTTKPDYIVNNSELSEFWDLCKNEVSGRLSNSYISLYQFFRETDENKLAEYLFDQHYDVRSYLEEKQYEKDFPIYANIIKGQLHKAMKRKDLLYRSGIVMNHSDGLKDFPQELKNKITNYLTNGDLRNITKAFLNQNLDNPSAEQLQGASQARN